MRKSKSQMQFEGLMSALQFLPTPEQRDAKSAFWLALEDNPVADPRTITALGAVNLTNQPKVEKWWSVEGFPQWFLNKEEFRMQLESAAYMALSTLMEILHNPDANASARVAAAKLVIEASGKSVKVAETQVADKMIQSMSERQLEDYINKRAGLLLKPEEVTDGE
jgi:transcriptional regulator with AAA-type ATPase domain